MVSTRQLILDAGVMLWENDPLRVTTRDIAKVIGFTSHAVLYHFKTARQLREAIAVHAVEVGNSSVIVQLIATKHPAIRRMHWTDRQMHLSVFNRFA